MEMDNTSNVTTELISQATGRTLGCILLITTIIFLLIYSHVLYILVHKKLWRTHSFFLWCISLSLSDMSNLFIYSMCGLSSLINQLLAPVEISIFFGHFYNFFFLLSFAHLPLMALIRTLAIVWPIASLNWFTIKSSLTQIAFVLLLFLALTFGLQWDRGNWIYYDPSFLGWVLAHENLYSSSMDNFWITLPSVCIISAIILYSMCIYKLRSHAKEMLKLQMTTTLTDGHLQNAQAEKNLVKIGFSFVPVFTMDVVFWRIQSAVVYEPQWWTSFALTMVEVLMYGSNGMVLLGVSREMRQKSALCHFISAVITKKKKIMSKIRPILDRQQGNDQNNHNGMITLHVARVPYTETVKI